MSWISEKISIYSDKIVNYTPAVPYISLENPIQPSNDKIKRGCCAIL
jgi:hypothetical protein